MYFGGAFLIVYEIHSSLFANHIDLNLYTGVLKARLFIFCCPFARKNRMFEQGDASAHTFSTNVQNFEKNTLNVLAWPVKSIFRLNCRVWSDSASFYKTTRQLSIVEKLRL